MNNTTKKGAFTLIELLIVVAIIGVLAGIVVISISGSTDDANKAAKKSNLRVMGTVYAQAQGLKVNGKGVDLSKFCGGDMGSAADGLDILESQVISVMSAVFNTVGNTTDDEADRLSAGTNSAAQLYTNKELGATSQTITEAGCASSANGWVVWTNLSGNDYWCIDSRGFAGEEVIASATLTAQGKIGVAEVDCKSISS